MHYEDVDAWSSMETGGGLIAAFLAVALTPTATAAAVLGTNTGAFNACDVRRDGGGLDGGMISCASEPSNCAEGATSAGVDERIAAEVEMGGVKAGADAVSFGDGVETAGLEGSQTH